jgi:hypothetical protein
VRLWVVKPPQLPVKEVRMTRPLAVASLFIACTAHAQVLLQTGFESAPFTAGLPVDGQAGWLGLWGPEAAKVSATGARTGRQCVSLNGADLVFARPGVVAGTCGTELFFDPVARARPLVHIQADVRLSGPDTGEGPEADLLSANLFVASSSNQVFGGYFVSSNGTIYAFGRAGQDYMFPTPYTLGTYARLEMDMDFVAGTIACRVDGDLIGTLVLDPLGTLQTTEIWTAALEMASIDDPILPDRSLYDAHFDNVSVLATPRRRPR